MNLVALVPAAGRSERMGRPKLTLSLGSESVIQRVVRCLDQAGANPVVVIAPPVSQEGSVVLANHARVEGAFVVHCLEPTGDMRATIEFGLDSVIDHGLEPEGLVLSPADFPGISKQLVARLLSRFQRQPDRIVVPVFQGRRGHPIILPFHLAREVSQLPPGVGFNALLELHSKAIHEVLLDDAAVLSDLDTLDDYKKWMSTPRARS